MSLDLSKIIHNVTINNKPVAIYNKADTLSPFLVPARKLFVSTDVFSIFLTTGLFQYNTSLEEVEIGDEVYNIGSNFFRGCVNLRKATVNGGSIGDTYSYVRLNEGAFGSCSKLKEVYFPNAIDIRGSAFQVHERAFYECPIEVLSAPKVQNIGDGRIFRETKLSSIYLPECRTLGDEAFYGTLIKELSSANLPKISSVDSYCFAYCKSLSKVQLDLTSVGARAFTGCTNLKEVVLPNVSIIEGGVFNGCTNLEYVSAPNVTEIKSAGFSTCGIKEVFFPNLSILGYGAFENCKSLKSVNLPNLSQLGSLYNQFIRCDNLSQVNLPILKEVADQMFLGCFALESVNMPECETIGTSAFSRCGFSVVSFPKCITIGQNAFYTCRLLESADFPNCINIISSAFYNCENLKNINLPKCETISAGAFYSCKNLEKLSLPKCLSILGNNTFSGCSKLSAIILAGSNVVSVNSASVWSALSYTPIRTSSYLGYYGSIYVPASLISNYISVWGTSLSSRITSIENWVGG